MTRSPTPLSLENILLGFLCEHPIHGYDLYKKISDFKGISIIWHIKQSQLYSLLNKLEEDGLLTSRLIPGEAHLMRKEFQITPLGRQTFLSWLACPVMHGRYMRQEFLAKLYFALKSGAQDFNNLIEKQSAVCAQWLSDLQVSYSGTTVDQHYERMIFQYRISQTRAMLEWLKSCREAMPEIFSN
jgi:PadR family transcriptional regulator, regulatory protein AphA